MQVLSLSDIRRIELLVRASHHVDDTHIHWPLWLDVAELLFKEILERGAVVEATLEEETASDTSEPASIQLSIRSIFPELFHSISCLLLLSFGIISKDNSIDGSAGHPGNGIVSILVW